MQRKSHLISISLRCKPGVKCLVYRTLQQSSEFFATLIKATVQCKHEQAKPLPVMTASSKALHLCSTTVRCISTALQQQRRCIYWWWPPKPNLDGALACTHPSSVGDGNHHPCNANTSWPPAVFREGFISHFQNCQPFLLTKFVWRLDLVGHVCPSWHRVKARWQNSRSENCTRTHQCAVALFWNPVWVKKWMAPPARLVPACSFFFSGTGSLSQHLHSQSGIELNIGTTTYGTELFEDLPYFYQIPHCLVRAYSFDRCPLPSSGFSLIGSTSYSLDFNLKTAASFHLPPLCNLCPHCRGNGVKKLVWWISRWSGGGFWVQVKAGGIFLILPATKQETGQPLVHAWSMCLLTRGSATHPRQPLHPTFGQHTPSSPL